MLFSPMASDVSLYSAQSIESSIKLFTTKQHIQPFSSGSQLEFIVVHGLLVGVS